MTDADNPAISVVVPVRDGAEFLPATLNSLRRARGRLEIIVVDDGSSDETPNLLAGAAARDPRIRVLRCPPRGIVAALEEGVAAARAPWIGRLDADDLAHPERFVRQLAHAEAAGLDVVGTAVRCFPTQHIRAGMRRYQAWQNGLLDHDAMARARFVESPLVHPSALIRRAALDAVGGYRDAGWAEDYDLWLRLFAAGARFGKLSAALTFWRDHPRRLTRTAAQCSAAAFRACKAHHLARGPLARVAGIWIAGAGRDGKQLARALIAEGVPLRGWMEVDPRRLGQRIHGARVYTAEAAPRRPDEVILAAVGGVGGRARIRGLFARLGWREAHDYWCVA